jgi:hypothetical protein
MTIQELIDDIEAQVEAFFNDVDWVSAEEVGLDKRCGRIMIGENFVATDNARILDYYGGFEYVEQRNKENVKILGQYKVYFSENEDDRVGRVIQRWKDKDDSQEDEEEEEIPAEGVKQK